MAGVTVGYYAQTRELPSVKEARPEYREIGSQVLQDVIRRVEHAFAAFFRRVQAGEKPGYPRFRSRDRYDSFTYSQAGWKLADGRLVLTGIGALKVRWSQPLAGTIKTVTITRPSRCSTGPDWPTRYAGTLWPVCQRQNPPGFSRGSVNARGRTPRPRGALPRWP